MTVGHPRREPDKAPARPPAPFARRLVIMAKVPVMGAVKTRLAREVGPVAATYFYRHTASAVLARLSRDPRWRTLVAVAPDTGVGARIWPVARARLGQGAGDLGQRMQRLLELRTPGPIVIIGTDIPAISTADIARAFRLLGAHDAVLGPAEDGGYWLVGLRRTPKVLRPFAGVRWSGPHALADTAANLAGSGIAYADTHGDVDDAASLARFKAHSGRRCGAKNANRPRPQDS